MSEDAKPVADRNILEIVERTHGALRRRALAERFDVADDDYRAFCKQLGALKASGLITEGRGGKYRLIGKGSVLGRLSVKARGFGFVVPVSGAASDIYVAQSRIGAAMDGDLVLAEVGREGSKRDSRRGPSASKLHIVERGNDRVVGTFIPSGNDGGVVMTDNRALPDIEIPPGQAADAGEGIKVVAEITRFPRGRQEAIGRIVDVLGEAGALETETLSVIASYGLRDEFPAAAAAEADEAPLAIDSSEHSCRADYTKTLTVTIDPVDAKDFDDAVSLSKADGGGWKLLVHITDVSAAVPEGSAVDKEARLRSTSTYLPGHVIPMLPERLTQEVCCLREAEVKLAKTVTLIINTNGEVKSSLVERSLCRSTMRLDYGRVFEALENGADDGIPADILKMLAEMRLCSQAMRKNRIASGAIEMEMPEPRIRFDDEGEISEVVLRQSNFAHQLVEEFMLVANQAVAAKLSELELAGLFRNHDEPDEESLDEFAEFVRGSGGQLKAPYSKANIQKALDKFRGTKDQAAINLAFLQSLKQARYAEVVRPHWALAFDMYCHFTSPIRRYPDLLVHRALDGAFVEGKPVLVGKKSDVPRDGDERRQDRLQRMAHVAEVCSSSERKAEKAERELNRFCELLVLQRSAGTMAKGIITNIEKFGFFIEIEGYSVHGFIAVSELPGGPYKFSRKHGRLEPKNRGGGDSYSFGQDVTVAIDGVDLATKQLKLSIAD